MLTGQPPHLGGSAQQIIMKIITKPADLVTTHRKSVPPNVAAAVATSLEKLPADRFKYGLLSRFTPGSDKAPRTVLELSGNQ